MAKWVEVTPDPAEILAAKVAKARDKRNSLLSQSDWTQVVDATVDQTAWATYRQALRDVPAQAGFPENIDWPVAPEVT
ncbi:phage tail assembly chaperone [Oceanospirillaceae bacterium]|nr:phage tail assembly chaperone [Oceanospirillaceae bacterium]